MLGEIRQRLREKHFRPFVIRTADGQEFSVPTSDHAWVTPTRRLWVEDDKGGTDTLFAHGIVSLREAGPAETTSSAA